MIKYILIFLLLFCKNDQNEQRMKADKIFSGVQATKPISSDSIELGKKLFFERGLSINNRKNCADCHEVDNWGIDGLDRSVGTFGNKLDRNSPSIFYSSYKNLQSWDGRYSSLEEQSLHPIFNKAYFSVPNEKHLMDKLKKLKYDKEFKDADIDFTYRNIGVVLAEYQRTLVSRTKWEDWIEAKIDLTKSELNGFKLFYSLKCQSCHGGPVFGGRTFAKMGLLKHYDGDDLGRFIITGIDSDRYVFRVPILRGISHTGPYFSDGSIKDLNEVIKIMGSYQIGKELSDEEIKDIRSFLNIL